MMMDDLVIVKTEELKEQVSKIAESILREECTGGGIYVFEEVVDKIVESVQEKIDDYSRSTEGRGGCPSSPDKMREMLLRNP